MKSTPSEKSIDILVYLKKCDGDWKRETPKYTQIGNAVPVKLSEEIGVHLKKILG
jgi:site-specific DNA-cytosine methylase